MGYTSYHGDIHLSARMCAWSLSFYVCYLILCQTVNLFLINRPYAALIGESPQSFLLKGHVYHTVFTIKETTSAFEEFVQLAYAFLTHKLLKKEELHWIYQKEIKQRLPQINGWRTVYTTDGCKKPLLILIN